MLHDSPQRFMHYPSSQSPMWNNEVRGIVGRPSFLLWIWIRGKISENFLNMLLHGNFVSSLSLGIIRHLHVCIYDCVLHFLGRCILHSNIRSRQKSKPHRQLFGQLYIYQTFAKIFQNFQKTIPLPQTENITADSRFVCKIRV